MAVMKAGTPATRRQPIARRAMPRLSGQHLAVGAVALSTVGCSAAAIGVSGLGLGLAGGLWWLGRRGYRNVHYGRGLDELRNACDAQVPVIRACYTELAMQHFIRAGDADLSARSALVAATYSAEADKRPEAAIVARTAARALQSFAHAASTATILRDIAHLTLLSATLDLQRLPTA